MEQCIVSLKYENSILAMRFMHTFFHRLTEILEAPPSGSRFSSSSSSSSESPSNCGWSFRPVQFDRSRKKSSEFKTWRGINTNFYKFKTIGPFTYFDKLIYWIVTLGGFKFGGELSIEGYTIMKTLFIFIQVLQQLCVLLWLQKVW